MTIAFILVCFAWISVVIYLLISRDNRDNLVEVGQNWYVIPNNPFLDRQFIQIQEIREGWVAYYKYLEDSNTAVISEGIQYMRISDLYSNYHLFGNEKA